MAAALNAVTIARALGGASKTSKGWWHCKCPAHEDRTASLGLHDTDDGGVAWRCMAGCDSKAVGDALKAKGLLPERQQRERKAKRKIVATYDYRGAAGELVLQVVRYQPKDFRQRRPDPDKPGSWLWTIGDIRRPLYRLPELLVAEPAADVFLVEGEKDADRLRALGLTATTTAQGANGWPKSDHVPLTGRHVVLLPDNDDASRAYAAQAGRDLIGKVASLRLLALPGLPAKGDASDWINAGGTADELRHLAADAPLYDPPPAAAETENAQPKRWNELLHRNERGEARDIIHNVVLILRSDDRFKGMLRWNELADATEARDLPWRTGGWCPWTDADDLFLADWCQERHAYVKRSTCAAAVQLVARDLIHHPVRERLNTVVWDGVPRLGSWLTTYLGVTESAYANAVGRKWAISAVARAFQPGCKVDHALILEGEQRALKSTAACTLALDPSLFADELADLGTKDSAQDMRGKWVIEIAELSAMKRGDVERTKAFMSRAVDHYRPSYGTRSQDYPRQCVFIGSTNSDAYLQDETGNRRFWPVKVGTIDIEALRRDVGQLWAEGVSAYRASEAWWLDEATEQEASEEQEDRRVVDAWEERILEFCCDRATVTIPIILDNAISMDVDRQDPAAMSRVARILRGAGWKHVRPRSADGTRQRYYERPRAAGPTEEPAGPTAGPIAGNGAEPSEPAGGPTGPTGPTVLSTHIHAHAHARAGTHCGFTGPPWSGRTSRTSSPAWTDLDGWRAEYRKSIATFEGRLSVVVAWAKAAGAKVDTTNDNISVTLPSDLKPGLALAELRRLTREMKVLT